jgi:hypothetical protein
MLDRDIIFKNKCPVGGGVLAGIVDSYKKFYGKFLGISNNFKRAPLLENEFLKVTVRGKNFLTVQDLEPLQHHINFAEFANLTISTSKLSNNGNLLTKRDLENKFGFNVPRELYTKISGIYRTANTRYGREEHFLGLQVAQSFKTWRKGSRRFRNILINCNDSYVPHNLVKFAQNTDTVITLTCSERLGTIWTWRPLSNQFRTFLFKMYNNLLPYNTILSHFVRGKSRNCTICDVTGNQEINDETVLHLFYDCVLVNDILTTFFSAITNSEVLLISRHELFCCFKRFDDDKKYLLCMAAKIFIAYIWECRLRASPPEINHLLRYFRAEINLIDRLSTYFSTRLRRSGLGWHF